MVNYSKLMDHKPTKYGEVINQFGQKIEFYEDPLRGDSAPVIAVCHNKKQAGYTDFFDIDDFEGESDYNPIFIDGEMLSFYETVN